MTTTNKLPREKKNFHWEDAAYRHHVLVDGNGKVMATVTGAHPLGHYKYRGDEYTSLAAAKRAAERDYQ